MQKNRLFLLKTRISTDLDYKENGYSTHAKIDLRILQLQIFWRKLPNSGKKVPRFHIFSVLQRYRKSLLRLEWPLHLNEHTTFPIEMNQSVSSVGQGGASYESVANGSAVNYCYNQTPLAINGTFVNHVNQLTNSVSDILADIELQSGRQIAEYVIGKTACPARKNKLMDRERVLNAYFWKGSAGPGNRWNNFYLNQGYQGLVVICGVTHDQRPHYVGPTFEEFHPLVHQVQYALALEQALIHEFVLNRQDLRCQNTSFSSGSTGAEDTAAIGVVYIAFKLHEEESEEEDEDGDDDEVDDEVADVVNFIEVSDLVDLFKKRVSLGDDQPTSEFYTAAVDKYDSFNYENQRRCVQLFRSNSDATSDDEDEVQELVGFASEYLDDLESKALLLHAMYGSDGDYNAEIDTALSRYYDLTIEQQSEVMELL